MKESLRYIFGYLIGFTIFIVLIPAGFIKLSQFGYLFHRTVFISSDTIRYILFAIFFVIGVVFAIWSNLFLYKVGKGGPVDAFGVSISPQTKKLVTTGPYKYCRNPMVFGAFSFYTSLALFLNSLPVFIALIIFICLIIILLKISEEKRLLKDLGDEFLAYKKHVPMIFPVKFHKSRN